MGVVAQSRVVQTLGVKTPSRPRERGSALNSPKVRLALVLSQELQLKLVERWWSVEWARIKTIWMHWRRLLRDALVNRLSCAVTRVATPARP